MAKKPKGKQKQGEEEKPATKQETKNEVVVQGEDSGDPLYQDHKDFAAPGGGASAHGEENAPMGWGADNNMAADSWGANHDTEHTEITWGDTPLPIPPPGSPAPAPSGFLGVPVSHMTEKGNTATSVPESEDGLDYESWDTNHNIAAEQNSGTQNGVGKASTDFSPLTRSASVAAAAAASAAAMQGGKVSSASGAVKKLAAGGHHDRHESWTASQLLAPPPPAPPKAQPMTHASQYNARASAMPTAHKKAPAPVPPSTRNAAGGGHWGVGSQVPSTWRQSKSTDNGWSAQGAMKDNWSQGRGHDENWGARATDPQRKGGDPRWAQPTHPATAHQSSKPRKGYETWGREGDTMWDQGSESSEGDYSEDDYDDGHHGGGGEWGDEGWGRSGGGRSHTTHGWDEGGNGWGQQTNNDAWGAPSNATPAPAQAKQPSWKGWGEEARRLPKVTFAVPDSVESRSILSPQQRSEKLQSLLNDPQSYNNMAAQVQNAMNLTTNQPTLHRQHHVQQQQNHGKAQSQDHGHGGKKQSKKHSRHRSEGHHSEGNHLTQQQEGWGDNNAWGAENNAGGNSAWDAPDNSAWGNEKNSAWGGENSNAWGGETNKTNNAWGSETNKTSNAWGVNDNGNDGWDTIAEEDEDDRWGEQDRHVQLASKSGTPSDPWGAVAPNTPSTTTYTMPSRTLAYAQKGMTVPLQTGIPRNSINDYTDVRFLESNGEALKTVQPALFGRARLAKDRFHWDFPSSKDERVINYLTWIETMSYNLGTYGLHKFLQSRERGALITNVNYQHPQKPNMPAFDWMTFDDAQSTMDKIFQESIAFYDPSVQVIVFVFLPSPTGNSIAIWRRKVLVPNNTRQMLIGEIDLAIRGLRREKDYVVHVDQLPADRIPHANTKTKSLKKKRGVESALPLTEPKKKRKWWQIFKSDK